MVVTACPCLPRAANRGSSDGSGTRIPSATGPVYLVRAVSIVPFMRAELPFLRRCEVFVYPIGPILIALVLSLPVKLNATEIVVFTYFG